MRTVYREVRFDGPVRPSMLAHTEYQKQSTNALQVLLRVTGGGRDDLHILTPSQPLPMVIPWSHVLYAEPSPVAEQLFDDHGLVEFAAFPDTSAPRKPAILAPAPAKRGRRRAA